MMLLNYHYFPNEEGAKPVLVFLHGLFGSATNWLSIARSLTGEYSVIALDLRNHGDSFHHDDVSYQVMAADVRRLLDHLDIDSAVLIGHSMGGKVAMQFALQQPMRVIDLVIVDIAPVSYTHNFDDVFRAFDAVDLASLKSRRMADEQMSVVIDNPALRGFLLQNLKRDGHAWQWRINLPALQRGMSEIVGFEPSVAVYKKPTLFVAGSESDYILPKYQQIIEKLFPQVNYCQVQKAGHWVYAEQPKAFMRCLQRFLSRLE